MPFQPDPDERCEQCGFKLKRPPSKRKNGRPKSAGPKRDWTAARQKVADEGVCRLGRNKDCQGRLEAAHIIGRSCDIDASIGGPEHIYGEPTYPVMADRIVPLCSRHHKLYDSGNADVLPVLTIDEQVRAVLDADGLELARRRVCPTAYRQEAVA